MGLENYSNKTILIVDDSEAILRNYSRHIKDLGIKRVITSKDGLDALVSCKSQVPDLILLDIYMPEMNAWQFIEKLRDEKIATKIIIFSSENVAEAGMLAQRLGATDFIPKSDFLDSAEIKIKNAFVYGRNININTAQSVMLGQIMVLKNHLSISGNDDEDILKILEKLEAVLSKQDIDKDKVKKELGLLESSMAGAAGNLTAEGLIQAVTALIGYL